MSTRRDEQVSCRRRSSNNKTHARAVKNITPDDMDRIVAILDRMLDLAVALNSPVNREEFVALRRQLDAIIGLGVDG